MPVQHKFLVQAGRLLRRHIIAAQQNVSGQIFASRHRTMPMRVVMTLLVRDEVDIVAATLEHAFSLGVAYVIATDNGSIDGTTDILAAYAREGRLELHHQPDHIHDQARWVTAMARRAARVHGASWVLNADADEFVWPLAGPVVNALPDRLAGIDAHYGLVGLTERVFFHDTAVQGGWMPAMMRSAAGATVQASWGLPFWKVIHRADGAVRVRHGNHFATGPRLGRIAPELNFEVLHFPDRGRLQYEKKIRQGGAAVAGNRQLPATIGTGWRHYYEMLMSGQFDRAYADRGRWIAELTAKGLVTEGDDRLARHFETLVNDAVRPDLLRAVTG